MYVYLLVKDYSQYASKNFLYNHTSNFFSVVNALFAAWAALKFVFVRNCLFYIVLKLLTSNENHTKKPRFAFFADWICPYSRFLMLYNVHCTMYIP